MTAVTIFGTCVPITLLSRSGDLGSDLLTWVPILSLTVMVLWSHLSRSNERNQAHNQSRQHHHVRYSHAAVNQSLVLVVSSVWRSRSWVMAGYTLYNLQTPQTCPQRPRMSVVIVQI